MQAVPEANTPRESRVVFAAEFEKLQEVQSAVVDYVRQRMGGGSVPDCARICMDNLNIAGMALGHIAPAMEYMRELREQAVDSKLAEQGVKVDG